MKNKTKKLLKQLKDIGCEHLDGEGELRAGLMPRCFDCVCQTYTFHDCIIKKITDLEFNKGSINEK